LRLFDIYFLNDIKSLILLINNVFESEICRVQQQKPLYYSISTPKRKNKEKIILIIEITFTMKLNLKV